MKKSIIYSLTFLNFITLNISHAGEVAPGYKLEGEMQNFIVIGDTGKQTVAQREVANSIEKYCSTNDMECDSAFMLGDNLYHAGMESADDPKMDMVFRDYYQNLNFPFYVVLGNHDYGKYSLSLKKANYELEYSKRNPQFIMPARFYIKVFKDVVVAHLDTTRMMWKKDLSVQGEMVLAASKIAREKNLWLMVTGHHPYLSNGGHGNAGHYDKVKAPYFASGKYVKRFFDKYVCPNADLYLSGHDHSLQLIQGTQAGCKTYLVVSGAGGSGSSLTPRNQVDFETTNPGYFHFKVEPRKIEIRAVNSEANEVFTKVLTR